MKRKIITSAIAVLFAVFMLSSCQKSLTGPNGVMGANNQVHAVALGPNQSLAVAAAATDTIYVVNTCQQGGVVDSIAVNLLPAPVVPYLTTNYPGYNLKGAYSVLNSSKVVQGYVVVITYNSKPVGLAFDANGTFKNVLEQREKRDLLGIGWHEGGRFDDRDGHHQDTLAISALPGVIKSYFSSHYPSDTLQHAFVNRDSSYLVVSADAGIFLNTFTQTGSFVKRVQVYPHVKMIMSVTQAGLPGSIQTYLSTTYPAYVLSNAWELNLNGTIKGYLVLINANNIRYAVIFDGSCNFAAGFVVR